MPDLKPGVHTIELEYDTATELGVLKAQREVIVEEPVFRELAAAYKRAAGSGDRARAAEARDELISRRNMRKIAPGEAVPVDQLVSGPQVPHMFSATVEWYPDKHSLRVVVDAVDSHYASAREAEHRVYRGFLDIYVCPSGVDDDINGVHVIGAEEGGGKAHVGLWPNRDLSSEVEATWNPNHSGYAVEIEIPWHALKGYREDWKLLPVEAKVCSKWRDWSYFVMNRPGEPRESARSYAVLTRD